MPLLPTTAYSEYTLSSNQPTLKTESVSGKSISRHVNGHQWEININFPVLTAAEFAPIYGFLVDKSTYKTFTLTLPDREPRGVATGTPLVNGALAKGISSIVTDGWTISQTGILKAGDLLLFAGHTHVYMIISDTNSDGSGNSTLSIMPPLKDAIANNEAITVNSVPFTVLCTKQIEESIKAPILYDFNFDAVTI